MKNRKENGKSRKLENLAFLLGSGEFKQRYTGGRLPLHVINVLPQPRRTFEDIESFSQGIASNNILNPIIVACLTPESFERYVAVINLLWNTSFNVKDFHATRDDGKRVYYVLIAGERRLRAFKYLWDTGCERCREKYGKEPKSTCFARHFRGTKAEVRLCREISPLAALFLQFSENTHMPVPPWEEAEAYSLLFRLLRQTNPELPVSRFARQVGRSPETIKNALRFCELPVSIQGMVSGRSIPYGVAVEITRLHIAGIKEEDLQWWALRAIIENAKVVEFHERITNHLTALNSGQISLLDVVQGEKEKEERRLHIRRVVQANAIQYIWSMIHYVDRVYALFEEGKLGREDSPFSERSPLRILGKLTEQLRRLLPHLRSILSERKYKRMKIEKTVLRAEKLVAALESQEDNQATNG